VKQAADKNHSKRGLEKSSPPYIICLEVIKRLCPSDDCASDAWQFIVTSYPLISVQPYMVILSWRRFKYNVNHGLF
jgi:hypothetical protein